MYNVVIGMITVDRHFPAHMPSLSTLAIQWQAHLLHSSYSLTLEQAQRLLRLQHTQCWGCPPASRTAHPHTLARGGRLAVVANQGMLVQKAKASGQRKQRAYLPTLHPHAKAAIELAESRFAGAGN